MKFDRIIQNPPYRRNLHLKVLAQAIKHLKDDDSKVVNLSPVRWLQDPLAKHKKNSDYHRFKESVINHLANVCVIDDEAQAIFGDTRFGFDIAIYDARRNNENFDVDSLVNSIVIKVLSANLSKIVFDTNKKDGIRVRFPLICSNGDNVKYMSSIGKMIWFVEGMKDNKPWYTFYTKNQFSKFTDTIPYSAKFNSEIEADNFCKSYDTNFAKVYTHIIKRDVRVSPDIMLWLGDAINPRTGLKGYTGEWTDEDLYSYFKLTDDEIKIIEETMEKYNY